MFISDSASSAHEYGWFVEQSTSHNRLIWHYGIVDGFRAYAEQYPDDKVSIIILSNLDTLDVPILVDALEKVVFAT